VFLILFLGAGSPLLLDVPELHGFNFAGGGSASPEFAALLLGLVIYTGAFIAEIVRAGILAVDPGQLEAAQSLGMGRTLAMRRIVLPQAMRVIVPPTGNETIAMLKDTSLVVAVPVTNELFFQLQAIGARTFQSFPMLVAACIWYLALSSVLMVGQYFLERRFARGFGARTDGGPAPVLAAGLDH
jgi:polar amino acid transport system permease protein